MKLYQFIIIFVILVMVGCISSGYPLLKKEDSVILFPDNNYCFARSSIYVIQLSQCGFMVIEKTQNNGYSFTIYEDKHKCLIGTSTMFQLKKKYYARVHKTPLYSGPFKDWHILQVCSSASHCTYYAIRKLEDGRLEVACPSCGDSSYEKNVDSQKELFSAFTKLCEFPSDTVTFYPGDYLKKKWDRQRKEKLLKRKKNKGDL